MGFSTQLLEHNEASSTREIILLAAFDEIFRVGFQAASLSNILDNTGVTKGALYHHFPSKIDLGYAVVDEVIYAQVYSMWVEPLQRGNPIDVMIQQIQLAGSEITEEDINFGCPLNNISQEMSPIDAGFRERIDKLYQDWLEGLIEALERGQADGSVSKQVNAVQIGTMLVASLEGCIGLAKSAQSKSVLMDCGYGIITLLESMRA